ncbi:unnamed protein product [Taenia asiatica]|uniref:Uncharacterized protein n=1 Tax=Taenia asiatica TaxID=60517 RepID=A0A3P6PMR6_TAEAS|nr:unnamed protein product [Taenia asiatica]
MWVVFSLTIPIGLFLVAARNYLCGINELVGPLSFWNRRVGYFSRKDLEMSFQGCLLYYLLVIIFVGQSPHWYPLVSRFVNAQVDPKIVAGGTSGSLVAWDFSGDQLFETCSLEDPPQRMTSVLTVIEVPRKESNLAGALLVGGLSPFIHLVSRIGYPSQHVKLSDKW